MEKKRGGLIFSDIGLHSKAMLSITNSLFLYHD
jgi:hypothetical protein